MVVMLSPITDRGVFVFVSEELAFASARLATTRLDVGLAKLLWLRLDRLDGV